MTISAIAMAAVDKPEPIYNCSDGPMQVEDVARVARCTPKAARRAIMAYCSRARDGSRNTDPNSSVLRLDLDKVPFPNEVTRVEMARVVAEQLSIGVFGLQKRIAQRRRDNPTKPKERHVKRGRTGHVYRDGGKGRGLRSDPGEGGGHQLLGLMTCSTDGCGCVGEVKLRSLASPEVIDRKFIQQGWSIDPNRCPEHNPIRRKDETMASSAAPSPVAVKAQARMFNLLQTHFDPDKGCYAPGWNDDKIATETGTAPAMVAAVRDECFGPLKEPPEIAKLAADIEALNALIDETVAPLKTEIGQMRARLNELRRKYPA